jgi:hypothetical protein
MEQTAYFGRLLQQRRTGGFVNIPQPLRDHQMRLDLVQRAVGNGEMMQELLWAIASLSFCHIGWN